MNLFTLFAKAGLTVESVKLHLVISNENDVLFCLYTAAQTFSEVAIKVSIHLVK